MSRRYTCGGLINRSASPAFSLARCRVEHFVSHFLQLKHDFARDLDTGRSPATVNAKKIFLLVSYVPARNFLTRFQRTCK